MDDLFPVDKREPIQLRFWQDSGQLRLLASLLDEVYDKFQQRLHLVIGAVDALSCPLELLDLLAYQRDITRMRGEPEALFRRRVHFAAANARDAGCRAGFARIWERLQLGSIVQVERFDAVDWDVIKLRIDETVFASLVDTMLDELIQSYGRTCRRYRVESVAAHDSVILSFDFYGDIFHARAVL